MAQFSIEDYVKGFNLSLSIFLMVFFFIIILKKDRTLFQSNLAFIFLWLGLTSMTDKVQFLPFPPWAQDVAMTVSMFSLVMAAFQIVTAGLSLVRPEDEAVASSRKLLLIGIVTGVVLSVPVAAAWRVGAVDTAVFSVAGAMLVASLAYTTFLLVQKRRVLKGRRQSADLLILMMAANILAVPTIFALSWSADVIFSMVTENAILFVNGLLLIYMALYIDPVETHRRVLQRLSDNFEGLMRYGGDGVALLDKDGRMVSSNMSLRRILRGTCDFLEGREMVGFVPQASACHVRGAIRMALEGSTVIEVRHDLRPVGEGDGRDPTVVSTFSPVKTIDGKVEGVLVVMRDQTTVIDLEAERILRKRADAQNQLQKMLTSVIPYLLLGVDPVSRRVYLNIVLNDIEKDLSIKDGDPSPSDVARHLCSIMNNLGGRFRWASKKDSEGREGMVFYGLDCPWGTASRKNPFLCHLCRGIFTRLVGIDIGHGAQVALEETLAKGDLRCRIRVAGLGMGEVKRADIDECEGPGEHHGGGGRQEEDPDVLSDPASEGPIAGDAEATPASDAAGPNGAGVARLGTAVESMMFGPEVRT